VALVLLADATDPLVAYPPWVGGCVWWSCVVVGLVVVCGGCVWWLGWWLCVVFGSCVVVVHGGWVGS